MIARIPLILEPQPEGGYTVTSPLLPELITEGDTIAECLANAEDAFAVVVEIYEDRGVRCRLAFAWTVPMARYPSKPSSPSPNLQQGNSGESWVAEEPETAAENVYVAAEAWVERALRSDDSLFTPG